jgi:hypothetical protein
MYWIKAGLGTIVAIVFVMVLVFGIAVATGVMRLPLINIEREVTQHSQEYIETKRSLLLSLIADAESAQTSEQKVAIVNRFCEEYSYVDFDVPSSVSAYAARNCH